MITEQEQINALTRLHATEEADIDFLLAQLGVNLDGVAARTAVRSFRKQMILAATDVDDAPAQTALHKAAVDLFEGGFIDAGWKRVGVNSADAQWAMELEHRLKPLRAALTSTERCAPTASELLDQLLVRIDFDGMDPNTFTIAELRRAI